MEPLLPSRLPTIDGGKDCWAQGSTAIQEQVKGLRAEAAGAQAKHVVKGCALPALYLDAGAAGSYA